MDEFSFVFQEAKLKLLNIFAQSIHPYLGDCSYELRKTKPKVKDNYKPDKTGSSIMSSLEFFENMSYGMPIFN